MTQCCFNVRPTSATLANIKPTFGVCAVFVGKALLVIQQFVSQPKAHLRALVNYLLIDVAQVYVLSLICELALNAALGMKRT